MSRVRLATIAAKVAKARRSLLPPVAWFLIRERGESREAWDRRLEEAHAKAAAAKASGRGAGVFSIDVQGDEP